MGGAKPRLSGRLRLSFDAQIANLASTKISAATKNCLKIGFTPVEVTPQTVTKPLGTVPDFNSTSLHLLARARASGRAGYSSHFTERFVAPSSTLALKSPQEYRSLEKGIVELRACANPEKPQQFRGMPQVAGMRFADVHHVERDLILILFVELVESGNLPPERRSRVAAENQHNRFLAAHGRQLKRALWSGLSSEKSGAMSPTARWPLRATFQSGLKGSTTNAGQGTYFMVPANLSGDCNMIAKSTAVITPYTASRAPAIFSCLVATGAS